jgi:hypothetical protein
MLSYGKIKKNIKKFCHLYLVTCITPCFYLERLHGTYYLPRQRAYIGYDCGTYSALGKYF